MHKHSPQHRQSSRETLTGVYKQLQGFGFVDTVHPESGEKKGYYVHESKKLDALEGDEVSFFIKDFRGKQEAVIVKVIKRSEHLIIGTLKLGKTFAFVIPDSSTVGKDIFIPGKYIGGYPDGARVAVQIMNWDKKNPEGRIKESLQTLPKGREDIYKIAFEMGARKTFSEKVKAEVAKLQSLVSSETSTGQRKDLRHLLTYTIDGAESKDLDDAISVLSLNKGWKLFVHIADVAHFVRAGTALDHEAYSRATSIYLADQVIPMLPAEISNGLCSLHPGEDKLTLTCEMHVSPSGQLLHSEVYESIILSDYRLTYREIDAILVGYLSSRDTSIQLSPTKGKGKIQKSTASSLLQERVERGVMGELGGDIKGDHQKLNLGDPLQFGSTLSPELQKNIFLLKKLTDILAKNTKQRGGLDFDFPETKIILDEVGNPIEYKKSERYDSYKIIEECMVLANESVAKLFKKYPFLYRVHEDPDEEDIENFLKIIESLDEKNLISSHIPFGDILEHIKGDPKLEPFQKLLLRSLAKAKYSAKNIGHFGLGLKFYSHFTSPIRRYSDLQIHRIIKEILHKKYSPERKLHYKSILPEVARQCSEKSDKAEKMEYRVRDMLAVKYMKDKIGEIFTGKISGMTEKGFFIELENTIEGFVSYSSSGYQFESKSFTLTHGGTQEKKYFGDKVQVVLIHIDTTKYRIDFELV